MGDLVIKECLFIPECQSFKYTPIALSFLRPWITRTSQGIICDHKTTAKFWNAICQYHQSCLQASNWPVLIAVGKAGRWVELQFSLSYSYFWMLAVTFNNGPCTAVWHRTSIHDMSITARLDQTNGPVRLVQYLVSTCLLHQLQRTAEGTLM